MSLRSEIADFLTDRLPDTWRIYAYGRDLDGVGKAPTVMVEQKSVRPSTAAWGLLEVEVVISLAVGAEDPAKAEDALEDALLPLLDVVGDLPALSVGEAVRGVIQDRFNAYSLTLTVQTQKEN